MTEDPSPLARPCCARWASHRTSLTLCLLLYKTETMMLTPKLERWQEPLNLTRHPGKEGRMRNPHCQAVGVVQIEKQSKIRFKGHQTLQHFTPEHVYEKVIHHLFSALSHCKNN